MGCAELGDRLLIGYRRHLNDPFPPAPLVGLPSVAASTCSPAQSRMHDNSCPLTGEAAGRRSGRFCRLPSRRGTGAAVNRRVAVRRCCHLLTFSGFIVAESSSVVTPTVAAPEAATATVGAQHEQEQREQEQQQQL